MPPIRRTSSKNSLSVERKTLLSNLIEQKLREAQNEGRKTSSSTEKLLHNLKIKFSSAVGFASRWNWINQQANDERGNRVVRPRRCFSVSTRGKLFLDEGYCINSTARKPFVSRFVSDRRPEKQTSVIAQHHFSKERKILHVHPRLSCLLKDHIEWSSACNS